MTELPPDWPRPHWGRDSAVRACTTTRRGGLATGPRATFDLGHDRDDAVPACAANRRRLEQALGLRAGPHWLRQRHGTAVAAVDRPGPEPAPPVADAAWSCTPGTVCAVLTADCLPVVVAAADASVVAVIHAGWRGLAAGVIEAAVGALPARTAPLRAWLGPAIGPGAFEVGPEVREALLEGDAGAAAAFRPGRGDRWMADLYCLARRRLWRLGIADVGGGGHCTFRESRRFFSYRRDGTGTGRMATLAWIEPAA